MESLFTSSSLYEYVIEKLQTDITLSQKLSILFKSIQKDFVVDKYMAVIFLNYIKCLNLLESDDILLIFKTSKMKYFKFMCFWREYINQLIKYNCNMEKILSEGIKFLNVKEFEGKNEIIEFLDIVKNSKNKINFIIDWNSEWIRIEDINEQKIINFYKNSKIENDKNNFNFTKDNRRFYNENLNFVNDNKKYNFTKKEDDENFDNYKINGNNLEESYIEKENNKNFDKYKINGNNLKNCKIDKIYLKDNCKINRNKKEESYIEKENIKNFDNIFIDKNNLEENLYEDKQKSQTNEKKYNKNINLNINLDDFNYSPLLKKKLFLNTPSTGSNDKYSFKSPEEKNLKHENNYELPDIIKCKIEDFSIKEDTKLNILKISDVAIKDKQEINKGEDNKQTLKKQVEYFKLKDKNLQKIKIIGKGGSSKVYKVFYENEFFALKIINIELDSTLKDLLLEEIDLLIKLKDVNGIIKMIDYDVLPENIYILLEYGESDLLTFIKQNMNFNLVKVKYIWQEILVICKNIHEKRIIHGDLKPANFVFVKNKLKIIDFGISKALNANTTRLDLDMVCGTLNYCAPELFFDNRKRRSSDVWSLGIILYEMWYGKTPLDSYKTYLEKKENIINIGRNIKIKNQVDVVICKCLEVDCRKRPTVDELLKDEFLTGVK